MSYIGDSYKILITGGAGFIGSTLVRYLFKNTSNIICNIDKLTYAGNLSSLDSVKEGQRYQFHQIDICDMAKVEKVIQEFKPDFVMHLAAESHVDRSIENPLEFIETNVIGTYNLLEVSLRYYNTLSVEQQKTFCFHHISTDEVYGDLQSTTELFTESTSYKPNSPYSASKSSSDHFVRAWYRTYGLPIVITNCSNNYGPYHFPEKFIPHMILNSLQGKPLPIYGNGRQIRDWLFVDDHVKGLYLAVSRGVVGETYNIGGFNEMQNIEVLQHIFTVLEDRIDLPVKPLNQLITFVRDRPGHDVRYAIDASKISRELGWNVEETFQTGIAKTVDWYLNNESWWRPLLKEKYSLKRQGLV